MIPRYTHPDMGRIWSDQRRYETWLLVETAAADAMAAAAVSTSNQVSYRRWSLQIRPMSGWV